MSRYTTKKIDDKLGEKYTSLRSSYVCTEVDFDSLCVPHVGVMLDEDPPHAIHPNEERDGVDA